MLLYHWKGIIILFTTNLRFATRGITEELDFRLQVIIWKLIDELLEGNKIKVDYLQVFELSKVGIGIKIVHHQEVTPYQNEILIHINDIKLPRNCVKIFVIDDGTCSVMMFADEY